MTAALYCALILTALLAVDRLAVRAERRGWIHWRHYSGSDGAAGLFNDMETLLAPANRHVVTELRDREMSRHDQLSGDDALDVHLPLGVSGFRRGTAVVRRVPEMPEPGDRRTDRPAPRDG